MSRMVFVPVVAVPAAAIFLSMLSAPASVFAGPGSINGVVYESFSGVLRGATVTLQPLGWETTTSLSDGSFSFSNVPDGSYTLVVKLPSCTPFGCYKPTPVTVSGAKVFVTIRPNLFTPTPTPTPQPVGGVAQLPHVAPTASEASAPSERPEWLGLVVAAATTAGSLALGGAAWYARRRLSS